MGDDSINLFIISKNIFTYIDLYLFSKIFEIVVVDYLPVYKNNFV